MSIKCECFQVIVMAKPELSSAEKFLLIRVLQLYGSAIVSRPIKQLAPVLGLSDGVIQKARDALVSKKILIEEDGVPPRPMPGKRPGGRSPKAFRVSESYLAWLQSWSDEAVEKGGSRGSGRSKRHKEWRHYGRVHERERQALVRLIASRHQSNMAVLLFGEQTKRHGDKPGLPLLQGGGKGNTAKNTSGAHTPHYAHRLLLAVLLGLADEGGVVRGIGLGMLARLVGLERDSIVYPLGVLAEEGCLRSHVPGITGQMAFGLASGAFFLNIGHVGLFQQTPELLVNCRDDVTDDDHPFRVGWQLYKDAAHIQKAFVLQGQKSAISPFHELMLLGSDSAEARVVAQSETLEGVKSWLLGDRKGELSAQYISTSELLPLGFMGGDGALAIKWLEWLWEDFQLYWLFEVSKNTVSRYFQLKVEEYASDLLSKFWNEMGEGGLYPEELLKRIQQEMLPPSVQTKLERGSTLPPRLAEAFACFVYVRAWCMAYWIKVLLKSGLPTSYRGHDLSRYRITVLPISTLSGLGVTVSIVGKSASAMSPSLQMVHIKRIENRIESVVFPHNADADVINAAPAGGYWLAPPGIKKGLRKVAGS